MGPCVGGPTRRQETQSKRREATRKATYACRRGKVRATVGEWRAVDGDVGSPDHALQCLALPDAAPRDRARACCGAFLEKRVVLLDVLIAGKFSAAFLEKRVRGSSMNGF